MKKNTIALEISHKYIKVVFGTVHEGQVLVDLVKKFPISHLMENGMIKEKDILIKELSKINPVMDYDYQVSNLINNVSLILPPYGLEVYRNKQLISVISSERIINELDIKNIYSIIRNKKLPVDNILIDIIPDVFKIDSGEKFAQAPIGKVSSAIEATVKVHTLPKRIDDEYSDILRKANILIDRKVVSTFAASELLRSYKETPKNYFLIDVGAQSTTVSLIGEGQLFATRSFSHGGDNITDKLVSSFNISEAEAEKIKIFYGLDKRKMRFDYPVCQIETEEGTISHNVNELNEIIEGELEEFYKTLSVVIDQIASMYQIENVSNFPLLLIGGGSKLKGFVEFLKGKNRFDSVAAVAPKVIGARDPSLFATLGAILIGHKYPNNSISGAPANVVVSREE